MLWSFEKRYYINTLKKKITLQRYMSITGLMRRLSLVGIDAIWQLNYTGYLNFITGSISRVLLLILVHVQLLSCLFI